jgi:hypothetical protein
MSLPGLIRQWDIRASVNPSPGLAPNERRGPAFNHEMTDSQVLPEPGFFLTHATCDVFWDGLKPRSVRENPALVRFVAAHSGKKAKPYDKPLSPSRRNSFGAV